jgi:hypothetical protein
MRRFLIGLYKRSLKEIGFFGLALAVIIIAISASNLLVIPEKYSIYTNFLENMVEKTHLLEAFITVFVATCALYFFLKVRFGKGRFPSLGIERLLVLPGEPDPNKFKFRIAQHYSDLDSFVWWSDDELDIAQRHDLQGAERRKLYNKWFDWRSDAFLLLDRYDPIKGQWIPVSLSITLPLTQQGADRLANGKVRVLDFEEGDITGKGLSTSDILIDTWIVKKKGMKGKKIVRENHEHYAICLLFLHLRIFWNRTGDISVFVEADNPKVEEACNRLGFDRSRQTKDGAVLQVMSSLTNYHDPILRRYQKLILENISEVSSWPIWGR